MDNLFPLKNLRRREPRYRTELLCELCEGRTVLHLGCTDSPITRERFDDSSLLHLALSRCAGRLYGVDIDPAGIDFLRAQGFTDLHVGDILDLASLGLAREFDVVLAAEIIEHLSNPGSFLLDIRSVMRDDCRLVITVPNAHSLRGFLGVLFGREGVNPDHCCWFSPLTMEHLLDTHGFRLIEYFNVTERSSGRWRRLLTKPLMYFYRYISPHVSEGLVLVAERVSG